MSSFHRDISKDLITGIFDLFGESILYDQVSYPVYKSIPKQPPPIYVFIGNVIHTEDGTKDTFIYQGTVQVQVIDESRERADLKLTQELINYTRGVLKPAKATVFSCGTSTLVVLKHESFNTLVTQADNGISRIVAVDLYNFIIT